jgi:hypothetical protein
MNPEAKSMGSTDEEIRFFLDALGEVVEWNRRKIRAVPTKRLRGLDPDFGTEGDSLSLYVRGEDLDSMPYPRDEVMLGEERWNVREVEDLYGMYLIKLQREIA